MKLRKQLFNMGINISIGNLISKGKVGKTLPFDSSLVDYKCFVALLTYDGENIVCGETWRRVAVSSESLVYSDMGK